jgi:hypothetical protein
VRPKVRVQPRATAWHLARAAHDRQLRCTGQVPCRCASTATRG